MTRVIAEVGSNFKTYSDCLRCIEMAKEANADIVKFQMATFAELYGERLIETANKSQRDFIQKFNDNFIKRSWVEALKIHCVKNEIEFACSAFSVDGYKFLNSHISIHKVASCENNMWTFHEYLKSTGKDLIISLGVTSTELLSKLNDYYADHDQNITFMICSAQYPSSEFPSYGYYDVKEAINRKFGVGLSDHSLMVLGVHKLIHPLTMYYEKHFNPLNLTDRPDSGHSINLKQLKYITKNINKTKLEPSYLNEMDNEHDELKDKIKRDGFYRPIPQAYLGLQ